jgi:hypothetical protein
MGPSQTAPLRDSARAAFDELSQLLRQDLTASAPIPAFNPGLASLPNLKDWLVAVRGRSLPIKHPRLAFFAGDAADGKIETISNPQSAVCKMAGEINTDLQIYDLSAGAKQTTADHALAYGMMAVQPGLDAVGVALVDPSGIDEILTLETLMSSTRHDMAALLGAVIAARLARLPVVMPAREGAIIKKILKDHNQHAADHIVDTQDMMPAAQDLAPEIAVTVALAQLRTAALL